MFCQCGCGQITNKVTNPSRKRGTHYGDYRKFVSGHQSRCHSPEVRRLIGENTRRCLTGRPQTEELRKKRGDAHKGKPKPAWLRAKWSRALLGRLRPDLSGPNHYNWKGGTDPDRRGMDGKAWRWAMAVKRRDQFTCQRCGLTSKSGMHAHHLWSFRDYPEKRYDVENGVTLCRRCHFAKGTHRTPMSLLDLFVQPPDVHRVDV